MKIFETHAHYDDTDFDEDRESLLAEMLGEEGTIDCIVNVGASLEGCENSILLATHHERIYAALGVHPEEVESLNDKKLRWIKENASMNHKVVAIGEIGLDYHCTEPSKEVQKKWFREQLRVAEQISKPVIIHSRDACADTLECLRAERAGKLGGIIHCYSYSKEAAKEFLEMGFHIGIGGVVTFKNSKKVVEAVEYIPMERIVLETDSPYLAPEPHRGTRNDSRNISYVAERIAQIKGLTAQEVIDITNRNARKLFKL
jgi:TatD DNase family protein